jgi:aconitase A
MSTIPGLGHSIAHGVGRFDAAALIGDGFAFSEPRIVEVRRKGPTSTVFLEAGPA